MFDLLLEIQLMSNNALDRAEANLAASLEILKGLGGENAENT